MPGYLAINFKSGMLSVALHTYKALQTEPGTWHETSCAQQAMCNKPEGLYRPGILPEIECEGTNLQAPAMISQASDCQGSLKEKKRITTLALTI